MSSRTTEALRVISPYRYREDSIGSLVIIAAPLGMAVTRDWLFDPVARKWSFGSLVARLTGICGLSTIVSQRGPRGWALAAGSFAALGAAGKSDSIYPNTTRGQNVWENAQFATLTWFGTRSVINLFRGGRWLVRRYRA